MTYVGEVDRGEKPVDFWYFFVFVAFMFVFCAALALLGTYLILIGSAS